MTQLLSSTEIINLIIRLYFLGYRLPCLDTRRGARFIGRTR